MRRVVIVWEQKKNNKRKSGGMYLFLNVLPFFGTADLRFDPLGPQSVIYLLLR